MDPILIVEDQPDVRLLLRQVLEETGFDCLEASDGEAALQVLINCPSIALVVTDFQMPRMNGLQLLACMKTHPSLRNIPTIFITAENSISLQTKALQAGAHQVLFKPLNFLELQDCIHTLLAPLQSA